MMNPTYACPETSQANLQPETSESQHLLANLAIIVDPTLSINLQLQTLANLALIGVEASVADLTSNLGTMSSFWKQPMRVRAFTIRNLPPCSAEENDHAEINSRSPVTLKRIKTSPRERKGPGRRQDKRVTKVTGVPKKVAMTDFDEEKPVGPKVQQNLANIARKRWGAALANDELKAMLAKHAKSENCAGMTVTKVNHEIWTQLNNFKRKADLRLSNVHQSLQKASFGVLKS